MKPKNKYSWPLIAVIVILGVIALVYLGIDAKNKLSSRFQDNVMNISGIPIYNDPIFGKKDAKATMIYYYDYQCQWCRKFDLETFPIIKKELIDTGRLRVIFKDFSFLGRDSNTLALGAECIYRRYGRDKFLEYHTLAYQNQKSKNSGWGSPEHVMAFSKQMDDVDMTYLESCILNNTYLPSIIDDTYDGMLAGISSTPSFILGNAKISGAQPYEVFLKLVNNEQVSVQEMPVSEK